MFIRVTANPYNVELAVSLQVDAVRFTGDGEVYALKTIDKSKITRVGQVSS